MPSTYSTNLGIELIASGEQSGSWGLTTNTNLELLDEAIGGWVRVTLDDPGAFDAPNILPIDDGASSDGRNKWIEFYSAADLTSAAFVQLTPDNAKKITWIVNTLDTRDLVVFQGDYNGGRAYTIPNGGTASMAAEPAQPMPVTYWTPLS
jgi:hypothetical protein